MVSIGDVLDEAVKHFPNTSEEEDEDTIKSVFNQNVGKSSLINAILGEDRVIVSDILKEQRESNRYVFWIWRRSKVLTDWYSWYVNGKSIRINWKI